MIRKGLSATALVFLLALPAGAAEGINPAATPVPPTMAAPGIQEIPEWQARIELARLLGYNKQYPEALAEYEKVLKARPDMTIARIEMAKVLAWMGETDKALALFQDLDPKSLDDESRLALADAYVACKEYDKAESLYLAFLNAHPDDQEVRLRLADLLSWAKKYEQAIRQFETILAFRPTDIQVRRRYARVLGWAGRQDEAINELRKTLKQ